MFPTRARPAVIAVAVLSSLAWTQAKPPQPSTTPAGETTRQLTPAQSHGLELLKAAEEQTASVDPGPRAVLLYQIGQAYRERDPSKCKTLLKQAFMATLIMEESQNHMVPPLLERQGLQNTILSLLSAVEPEAVQKLSSDAPAEVRAAADEYVLEYFLRARKFDAARDLLQRTPESKYRLLGVFHYMRALPPERATEREAIFLEALQNFQNSRTDTDAAPEMSRLLNAFWRDLPVPAVRSAIDLILQRTESDEERTVYVHTERDPIAISPHEYCLFFLIPVLRELDPAAAQRELERDPHLASVLKEYPDGPDSPGKHSETRSKPAGSEPATPMQGLFNPESRTVSRVAEDVVKISEENPRQALARAQSLFVNELGTKLNEATRAWILVNIAARSSNRDPDVTRESLVAAKKLLETANAGLRLNLLPPMVSAYVAVGDVTEASELIRSGPRLAEEEYAQFSKPSGNDPTWKLEWMGAQHWMALVANAFKISPELAEEIAAAPQDQNTRLLTQITLARVFLKPNVNAVKPK